MNNMLAVHNDIRFISRVFTDTLGRQFKLTFLVALVDGEIKGRLVSAQQISKSLELPSSTSDHSSFQYSNLRAEEATFLLPVCQEEKVPETVFIPAFTPIVSPYLELYFFTSQPTRAPAFAMPKRV